MKILLKIQYDGTAYAGYQVQKNAVTVQQRLNEATSDLFGYECDITGCSRTDAGVHAKHFCATVQKRGENSLDTDISAQKIPFALNARLPMDISVCNAVYVSDDFHARYDVISKTYEYRILNSRHRDPFLISRAYHYPKALCDNAVDRMNTAASFFCGKHDFSSFMSSGSSVGDTVREVYYCSVSRSGDELIIRISADGFLYNMVRIISGTLLDVAKGFREPHDIIDIIASADRTAAGPTLPAHGLYLTEVKYGKQFF